MADGLKRPLLYTYGIPDLLFGLMIAMEIYLFPAFLTDYANFSLAVMGQILFFTGIIDVFCTLLGGVLLQKITLRFGGKYRSWFLIGPVIGVPLYVLQFAKIGNDWIAAIIIIVGFVTSHLLFNVIYAAAGSMVGRLSRLPDETTIMSASRAQGLAASGMVFSLTGLPMILFFGKYVGEVTGHTAAMGVYGVLTILGYWYLFGITSGKDPYDEAVTDPAGKESGQTIKEIISLVLRNPPLLFLAFAEIFRNTCILIVTGLAVYYFKYVLNDREFVPVFILAASIAALIGSLAASWIGVKIGKRKSYWIFLVLSAVVFASGKYLPETSWIITIAFCIASMFSMVAGSMSTALFSDTVVYGEWKSGRNIRAFIMSVFNVPIKLGVFIRSGVMSIGLMAIGFVANTDPIPEVVNGIRSMMMFAPAASCLLAAAIFYFGYKIEDRQVLQMQEEIDRGRPAFR